MMYSFDKIEANEESIIRTMSLYHYGRKSRESNSILHFSSFRTSRFVSALLKSFQIDFNKMRRWLTYPKQFLEFRTNTHFS